MDTPLTLPPPASGRTPLTYIIDLTVNLSAMSEEWAAASVERVQQVVTRHPLNRSETWRKGGKDYLRIVSFRESPNLVSLYRTLADEYERFVDMDPGMVQICIRNATYAPTEGLPPHLTRSRASRR